jgi:16S rRNA G966 N2-methylase RsmD
MAKRGRPTRPSERLFADPQSSLFEKSYQEEVEAQRNQPVECLGMTFPNDEERRRHFLGILREKLKDPEFREIEGFPIGSDEDILALSDPPYYTACPNPFLQEFVRCYCGVDRHDDASDPFVGDVTEGKTEHYYNVHTYHTKVPYRAIARFVLHYTYPGDVILDAFCGTGMTGLAAQACESPAFVHELDPACHEERIGKRATVLIDLSPAATHIAANYSGHTDPYFFERECNDILRDFRGQCAWMFTTTDPKSGAECPVDYYVWSAVFGCPNCGHEIVFWDEGVDQETGHKSSNVEIMCPNCNAENHRDRFTRVEETYFDDLLRTTANRQKEKLIRIVYRSKGEKSLTKEPDASDHAILERVNREPVVDLVPLIKMMRRDGAWGDMYRAGYHLGITHFHHFYYRRSLKAVAWLWNRVEKSPAALRPRLRWWLQSVSIGLTRLNRYFSSSYSQVNRYLKGFLYIAQIRSEVAPWYALTGKIRRMSQNAPGSAPLAISTSSATSLGLDDKSVDYIFTDPPFGGNIIYSELNFMWEAWLRVYTNQTPEAIVSGTQKKDLLSYQNLMGRCFEEYFRVLKPGHWMTVLFHNSKNAVWVAIQSALEKAGFVVADVRVFDKKQLTMKQQTTAGAVQKDLLISAYRPNGGLDQQFQIHAGTTDGVWNFVRQHLKHLPVFIETSTGAEVIAERQSFLLFDRMVAFHVQRGVTVPLSAAEYYAGLAQRFSEREGMYFLPEQVAEYDKKRMTVNGLQQPEFAPIDEFTAIHWLRDQLKGKPQTFQQLHPQFLKEIGGWQKHEKPLELSELLEQNFLRYEGKGEVPNQIHSYLSTNFKELRNLAKDDESLRAKGKDRWYVPDPNKAGDLEKLRERSLLKEFEEYRASSQKRLKVFRLEAVRAGFKKAWQERDYTIIIAVARKVPENVLQEDPKLLMWYDQAVTRTGGEE